MSAATQRDVIRQLVEYAYEYGYHEHGYDVVDAFADEVSQERDGAAMVALRELLASLSGAVRLIATAGAGDRLTAAMASARAAVLKADRR